MEELSIRLLGAEDCEEVLALYRRVSGSGSSGLARTPDEITRSYVTAFLDRAAASGLALGAWWGQSLVGELHAYRPGPRQFEHVLGDLTVAVDPGAQGRGIGSRLFAAFFEAAVCLSPPVRRIELFARSGNEAAIRLYERLGFVAEGRFVGRVQLHDGTTEDDIPMARLLTP